MKQLLLFSLLAAFMNATALSEPVSDGGDSLNADAIVAANSVIEGETTVFLPAVARTESIALYRVAGYPQAVFSLAQPTPGVRITGSGRLVVQDTAQTGRFDIMADIHEEQALHLTIDLVIPHGEGADMAPPEWVQELKPPAFMPDANLYSTLRYILLALSGLAFVIYRYGRRRNSAMTGTISGATQRK
ncbi:hypothetical protein AGMMS49545_19410 [Betaproteobacteria bacterium]|nr:hypothetical protein AGMMS49545_19410 [Betaproteobacteria bacterium]GHU42688.1 hypothetical protein AGMMS50289_07810 [Betaproteobacteria bacterium]